MRFLAADGAVLGTEERPGCAFNWMGGFGRGVPTDRVARVEVHTALRAGEPGTYAIGGSGVGRYRSRWTASEVVRRASSSCRRAPTSSRR